MHSILRGIVRVAPGLLLTALASSQGSDGCATPDPISGSGTFSFDTTSATPSFFTGGGGTACLPALGPAPPHQDVFFVWTAATPGAVTFETCGTGYDTAISIHAGGDCSATCLTGSNIGACTDPNEADATTFVASAGDQVLVQIGTYSGTGPTGPGTLTVSAAPPPPANDTCATPTPIAGLGSWGYDLTTALTEGFGGGAAPCSLVAAGNTTPYNDVFFAWTASASADYQFDNLGSGHDTVLCVHLGGDCSATCLDANDQGIGQQAGESLVRVFGIVAGDIYLIQVGLFSDGAPSGPGSLNVSLAPTPPANDTCASPDPIAGIGQFTFDSSLASTSLFDGGAVPCPPGGINNGAPQADVFFEWSAASEVSVIFDTHGTVWDTVMNVHQGSGCSATCLAYSDNSPGLDSSEVRVDGISAGEVYLIQIGGWNNVTDRGAGLLNVSLPPPPPDNDTCASPALAILGTTIWNNALATTSGFDGGDPTSCPSGANPVASDFGPAARDLFFLFEPTCQGDYVLSTDLSPEVLDTRLSVHAGSDCSATCLVSNDDIDVLGGNFLSEVTLTGAALGESYLVQIGTWSGNSITGEGFLTISRVGGPCVTDPLILLCDPANDHFQGDYVKLQGSSLGNAYGSGLHIRADDGPVGEFGFVLVSAGGAGTTPVSQGVLCLSIPQARYNGQAAANQGVMELESLGQFDAQGTLQSLVGNAPSHGGQGFDVPLELPFTPAGQTIQSGDTWYFQVWYRDLVATPGDAANFSNMIEVTFP